MTMSTKNIDAAGGLDKVAELLEAGLKSSGYARLSVWAATYGRELLGLAHATRKPELWKHFKGGVYDRIGVAAHSETNQEMVVYQDAEGGLYVRPLSMWEELPPCAGGEKRFTRVRT